MPGVVLPVSRHEGPPHSTWLVVVAGYVFSGLVLVLVDAYRLYIFLEGGVPFPLLFRTVTATALRSLVAGGRGV